MRQCDCPDGGDGGGDVGPPDPHWNDTFCLINADGLADGSQDIVDATGKQTLTVVNNPAASTEQFKYGDASVKFHDDHHDGRIELNKIDYRNPFTFEAWVRRSKNFASQRGTIFSHWHSSGSSFLIWIGSGSTGNQGVDLRISHSGNAKDYEQITTAQTALEDWTHVAFCWDKDRYMVYIDGVLDISYQSSTPLHPDTTTPLAIGAARTTSSGGYQHAMDGWMDDIRITEGVCRYLDDFEPPAKAPTQPELVKAKVVSVERSEIFIGDNDVEDF